MSTTNSGDLFLNGIANADYGGLLFRPANTGSEDWGLTPTSSNSGRSLNLRYNTSTSLVTYNPDLSAVFSGKVSSNYTALPSDTGTIVPNLQAIRTLLNYVTPEMFGTVGTGNDTALIQAALDTGKPVLLGPKSYYVTNALVMKTNSQTLTGSGRGLTAIQTDGNFNQSALGVIVMTKGQADNSRIQDLNVTNNFGSVPDGLNSFVRNFPPAIYARGCSRWTLERAGLINFGTCLDMRGNAGGAYVKDLWMSAYLYGIRIDGALDTLRFENVHGYVFNIWTTTGQNNNVTWWDIGRVDDLKIFSSMSLLGNHFHFYASAPTAINENNGGAATGCLVGYDFDNGNTGILIDGGNVTATACYFACNQPIVAVNGGCSLTVSDFTISTGNTTAVTLNNPGARINLSDCRTWFVGNADYPAVYNATGILNIHDINFLFSNQSAARTQPILKTDNGRSNIHDCYIDDRGSGSGTEFIHTTNDNWHSIHHNVGPGWNITKPSTGIGQSGVLVGMYGPNAVQTGGPS